MSDKAENGERVMRALKKEDSPVTARMQVFRNFVGPQWSFEGKTRAKAAGIKVEGQNPGDTRPECGFTREG